MRLRALFWDVDGTLAETERDGHRVAFNQAFAEHGLPLHWDPDTYGRWLTISGGHERLRACLRAHRGSEPSPQEVAALQASKQKHYARLMRAGALALRPGVADLIAAAHRAGLTQAIVTTSGQQALSSLEHCLLGDLRGAFSLRVCGEDVRRKKPDPEGYRLALERLDLNPEAVLVLEDSPQGLAAAVGAGLACVLTLSYYSRALPLETFADATAVVSDVGGSGTVLRGPGLRGPACQAVAPTLSYLQTLL